ncbi:MAG TPA: hypothetical protein VED40_01375 [Azospirillaceae bacterium]|nr:hypothetical protein [Azospirillaceae bacterium]
MVGLDASIGGHIHGIGRGFGRDMGRRYSGGRIEHVTGLERETQLVLGINLFFTVFAVLRARFHDGRPVTKLWYASILGE